MAEVTEIINIFLHLDTYLVSLVTNYGMVVYGLIFLVIFCETGLVVTPFLPGDSLLFAAGALAASSGSLNIWILFFLIVFAAIIGDSVNYTTGSYFGLKAFCNGESKIFKKEYLEKTELFYQKHGNKAIVLGRFFPIIRTFVPFVAGVAKMKYDKFIYYNVSGAIMWTIIFLLGGYAFGNIKIVKDNFTLVIFTIIILSLAPGIIHLIKGRHKQYETNYRLDH